jgi:hypothetical protein
MYEFFKDFAGPIATFIAAGVAAAITFFFNRSQTRFAKVQADVSIEKLNLDLFERHYAIYSSARQLVEYLVSKGDFDIA